MAEPSKELPPIVRQLFALLQSRKFLIGLMGWVAVSIAFVRGAIGADAWVTSTIAFVGILASTIAAEDIATKQADAKENVAMIESQTAISNNNTTATVDLVVSGGTSVQAAKDIVATASDGNK